MNDPRIPFGDWQYRFLDAPIYAQQQFSVLSTDAKQHHGSLSALRGAHKERWYMLQTNAQDMDPGNANQTNSDIYSSLSQASMSFEEKSRDRHSHGSKLFWRHLDRESIAKPVPLAKLIKKGYLSFAQRMRFAVEIVTSFLSLNSIPQFRFHGSEEPRWSGNQFYVYNDDDMVTLLRIRPDPRQR